jgi:hypothetical protein
MFGPDGFDDAVERSAPTSGLRPADLAAFTAPPLAQ